MHFTTGNFAIIKIKLNLLQPTMLLQRLFDIGPVFQGRRENVKHLQTLGGKNSQ